MDGEPVAVAEVDAALSEAIIAWPVRGTWQAVYEDWRSNVLPAYSTSFREVVLEVLLGDHVERELCVYPPSAQFIADLIRNRRFGRMQPRQIFVRLDEETAIELVLDDREEPVRCALIIKRVELSAIVPFFSTFHPNKYIAADSEVALEIFDADIKRRPSAKAFLSPLVVVA